MMMIIVVIVVILLPFPPLLTCSSRCSSGPPGFFPPQPVQSCQRWCCRCRRRLAALAPVFAFLSALAFGQIAMATGVRQQLRTWIYLSLSVQGRVPVSPCPDTTLTFFSLFAPGKDVTVWASVLHGLPLPWRPDMIPFSVAEK